MRRCYFLHGAYHDTDGPLPAGAVPVPHLPADGERWDEARGAFVRGL